MPRMTIVVSNSELSALPNCSFITKYNKENIVKKITEATESTLTGWAHDTQKGYLEKALDKYPTTNDFLKKIITDKNGKSILLDIMLYGKYIFKYMKEGHQKNIDLYAGKFQASLIELKKIFSDKDFADQLFKACEKEDFFNILPLACHEITFWGEKLSPFQTSELFGYHVAYQLTDSLDTELDLSSANGQILASYSIHEIKVLRDNKQDMALRGSILISKTEVNNIKTVYIVWAGTHNSATVKADLEENPGEASYRRGENQILQQIAAVLNQLNNPVNIIICGHSLGGALSQLTLHTIQRWIASNLKNNIQSAKIKEVENTFQQEIKKVHSFKTDLETIPLNTKIVSLTIGAWNSAGVLKIIADQTNHLAPILKAENIQQSAYFGLVGGDTVQVCGESTVLCDPAKNGANVYVLKIEPETTRATTTFLGTIGAFPAGLVLFGAGPFGVGLSLFFATAVGVKASLNKTDAHTVRSFTNTQLTSPHNYYYYASQEDGKLNSEACRVIKKELTNKSVIIGAGVNLINEVKKMAFGKS